MHILPVLSLTTEFVSAIRSQNGHGSHSQIPIVSLVRLLITFAPNSPSIIALGTSTPLMITLIAMIIHHSWSLAWIRKIYWSLRQLFLP